MPCNSECMWVHPVSLSHISFGRMEIAGSYYYVFQASIHLLIDEIHQRWFTKTQNPDHLCEKDLVPLNSTETQWIQKGNINCPMAPTVYFPKWFFSPSSKVVLKTWALAPFPTPSLSHHRIRKLSGAREFYQLRKPVEANAKCSMWAPEVGCKLDLYC